MTKQHTAILFKPSQTLIPKAMHAVSSLERMIGLLKHTKLDEREAMLIDSCKQVHTLFMKFPIDAIFIDKKGVVVGVEELVPWRISRLHWRADAVIETSHGWAKRHGITPGSLVEVSAC